MRIPKSCKLSIVAIVFIVLAAIAVYLLIGSKPDGEEFEFDFSNTNPTIEMLISRGVNEKVAHSFSDDRINIIAARMGEDGKNLNIGMYEEEGLRVFCFVLYVGDGKYLVSVDLELEDVSSSLRQHNFLGAYFTESVSSMKSVGAYTLTSVRMNSDDTERIYRKDIDNFATHTYKGKELSGTILRGFCFDLPKSGIRGLDFYEYTSFIAHYEMELTMQKPELETYMNTLVAYVRTSFGKTYNYPCLSDNEIHYIPDIKTEE